MLEVLVDLYTRQRLIHRWQFESASPDGGPTLKRNLLDRDLDVFVSNYMMNVRGWLINGGYDRVMMMLGRLIFSVFDFAQSLAEQVYYRIGWRSVNGQYLSTTNNTIIDNESMRCKWRPRQAQACDEMRLNPENAWVLATKELRGPIGGKRWK